MCQIMRNRSVYRRNRPSSHGIATLEFAMALPILLLLMVGITWLGYSVIAQTETLVQAREKAWQRRFDNAGQKPLVFPTVASTASNPLYSSSSDYVTESATKKVDVSPVFNNAAAPKASHTVLAGSWDHRTLDMNSPPNLKLYALAAANGVGGDLLSKIGSLTSMAGNLSQLGASTLSSELAKLTGGNPSGDKGDTAGNTDKNNTDNQKQADRGDIDNQIKQKKAELAQTNAQIDQLTAQSKANKNAPPPTGTPEQQQQAKKQQQAQQKDDNRKLKFLKDQKQRIQTEIDDLQDKRDSLD